MVCFEACFQCIKQFMVFLHNKGLNGSVQKDHLGF